MLSLIAAALAFSKGEPVTACLTVSAIPGAIVIDVEDNDGLCAADDSPDIHPSDGRSSDGNSLQKVTYVG